MAATPKYKVFNPSGEYVASCKYAADAAAIVAAYGDGAKIKLGHAQVLWVEGEEAIEAGDSYDEVASIVHARERAIHEKGYVAAYGRKA